VDIYSARTVKLGETPFLYSEVKDDEGKDVRWSRRAECFADYLIKSSLQIRQIKISDEAKIVRYVVIRP